MMAIGSALACTPGPFCLLRAYWRVLRADFIKLGVYGIFTDNFAAQSILASTAVALMDNLVDMPASRTGLC
jgi:hypothetical protein